MPIVTINPDIKAAIDKKKALADLDQWFAGELAKGFETAGGWKLGLSESDVTLLTGNYVLAQQGAALGMPIPPIVDMDGVPHPMAEIEELTAIMLAYGQHRAALSQEYATRKAAIEAGE
jgi:hypothetical protein